MSTTRCISATSRSCASSGSTAWAACRTGRISGRSSSTRSAPSCASSSTRATSSRATTSARSAAARSTPTRRWNAPTGPVCSTRPAARPSSGPISRPRSRCRCRRGCAIGWEHERRRAAPKALAPPRGDGAQRQGGGMTAVASTAASALRWLALRVYPFALLLAAWSLLSKYGVLGNAFVMPSPARVWSTFNALVGNGTLGDETGPTLQRVLIAYGMALAVGVAIGTLIGRLRWVRLALRPIVSFLFPTPKVALYPAMFIVFGLGSASKIAFGFAEALFPILLATAAGTSQVEPRLLWSAHALGTSARSALAKVVIPAALPTILTGARIGLVGAIIGVFMGEMIAGSDGLGHLMAVAYRTLRTADMYVAIITVSLIGYTLDRLFLLARGRLLAWSAEEES